MAERPGSKSRRMNRGNSEVNRRRQSECARRYIDVKKFRNLWRSKAVNSFKSREYKNFKISAVADWEPVELLKNKSDVISGWGSGDDGAALCIRNFQSVVDLYVDYLCGTIPSDFGGVQLKYQPMFPAELEKRTHHL